MDQRSRELDPVHQLQLEPTRNIKKAGGMIVKEKFGQLPPFSFDPSFSFPVDRVSSAFPFALGRGASVVLGEIRSVMPGIMADQLRFPVFFLLLLLGVAFRPSTCEPEPHTSVIRLPEGISDEGSSVPSERVRPSFSCPVTCFTTNPVCGADGVTYWCGPADAFCSGTEVAKLGFCDVGNGGNGAFPGQAFLLIHIVWLIVLGFHFLLGFF